METGKNRTSRMANPDMVEKMVELLRKHYHVCVYPQHDGGMFIMTADGMDGGDIFPDGTYRYDFEESVSLTTQTEEEIVAILNEYFEV